MNTTICILAAFGVAILTAFAASAAGQTTQPAGWKTTAQGQLILRPFANAPYPHASRADGYKGRATTYPAVPHYTDSTVAIFIPNGYTPGDTVDYVVHFHGHKNHVSKVLDDYKLPQQLLASKANAILLVPQGPKDAADSGGGKLELDPGGFAKLIDEVTVYLKSEDKIHTTQVGRIVLSAHSGGYKVAAAVLHLGGMDTHITDVLLLDASYGSLEWFADWCKADPSHRLVSLFTDHLTEENKELMGLLDKAKLVNEAKLSDESFAARGATFMHTKGPHDQVPVDYFGRLLPSFDAK